MGWFSNLFRREQSQKDQAQADRYHQLFSSFDHASMRSATPEQLAANRAQLHDLFSAKNWGSLDYHTKCQAVQALENDFAYQQGRPAKTVEVAPLRDGCYGGWNARQDTIRLNESLLKSGSLFRDPSAQPMPDANMQIFDTVAHEGYHAYQSYALEHPEVHADKAQLREWALNEGKYYDSGDKYLIQPQERDAWQYGYNATTQAFQGIEARNGPEPELPKAEYENNALASSYNAALAREQRRDPQVLQTMEQEMESACQRQGIQYDFTRQSQTADNAPQAQAQGVQQGQAPPGPVTRTISAQSIDMSLARGMDSPEFWNHHGNTKAGYMALAEKLPAVQAGLAQGRTLDELKQDPELGDCVNAYYNPDNMVKVMQTPDGGFEYEDNGRHRIMAAKELGYDIPVQVVNAQAYAQNQAGQLKQDAQLEQAQTQQQTQGEEQEQAQDENQEQAQDENQEQAQDESQEQTQDENQEQAQDENQEQAQDENQEQAQDESQEQAQDENQEQAQDENQEQAQDESQEQAQDENQEQPQDESQEQAQDENQEQAQDESQEQAQDENQAQAQDENQAQAQDENQAQAQDENQAQAQTDDLSMDQAAEQAPQEEQTQSDDLSMDQAAEQAPQEEQAQTGDLSMDQAAEQAPQEEQAQTGDLSMDQAAEQAPEQEQTQSDDLSMDQAAEQAPEQEQTQSDDLSMDQAAEQAPEQEQTQSDDLSMDQAAGEDASAAQEQDSSGGEEQSSGQEEDQSQGYSY